MKTLILALGWPAFAISITWVLVYRISLKGVLRYIDVHDLKLPDRCEVRECMSWAIKSAFKRHGNTGQS